MAFLDILVILLFLPVFYCYLLYPYLVQLGTKRFLSVHTIDDEYFPTISVILSAHNEELVIRTSIASILAQDYPVEKVEIIIGSDGSTDSTHSILEELSSTYSNIRTYCYTEQRGKMLTINEIVGYAKHDILFFIDADITLSQNSFRAHVKHYKDKSIGIVGGSYAIHSHEKYGDFTSESEYVSLEQQIRKSESLIASTVNVFGGNYSMRRSLWRPLPSPFVHDDVYVVLHVLSQGQRVIMELDSVAVDRYERSASEEFRRKRRSASRGFYTLGYFPELSSLSGNIVSLFLWSHKILRWLSPFFVLVACVVFCIEAIFLGSAIRYTLIGVCLVGLISAFIGYMHQQRGGKHTILGKLGWLIVMNAAYILGTFTFLMGKDQGTWVKATRAVNSQDAH